MPCCRARLVTAVAVGGMLQQRNKVNRVGGDRSVAPAACIHMLTMDIDWCDTASFDPW
jgi:hypothetical protein